MKHYHAALLALVLTGLVWSGVTPHDRFTWVMEVFPIFIALPLLLATHKRFPLTPLLYGLIALHAWVLMVGGHYTYALVPMGEWLKPVFGFTRNHYDRIGHIIQGFVPALALRELLVRTSPLTSGKWLAVLIIFSCLGISASYELLEWATSGLTGEAADSFLGTQDDVWDTQKDMAFAGLGAILSLLFLSRLHDRQLKNLEKS